MTKPFQRLPFSELPAEPRLAHAFALMEARELELDSRPFGRHRVHVRELGSGPPLLLIHGLMTHSYSFRYVAASLGEHFHVIAPDLPGAGRTDKPDVCYEPGALACWIGELCDAMSLSGVACVGNSLGGYLCLRAALARPELFSCLIDVHSPGSPLLRLRLLDAVLALPGSEALLRRLVQRDVLRWAHRNVHYYDETLKSLEEAREYGEPLATADGLRAFHRYLSETLSPSAMGSFCRELGRRRDRGEPFPVPLMLLYAKRDPMVPPSVGHALSQLIPSAPLVWMDETSHFPHVDTPERFVAACLPFLQEHTAGSELTRSQS